MSRKSSKSSKSSSERDFEVCAVSATSTPNKSSSAPGPSAGSGSPRLSPVSPATPSSARNVQFYTARQQQGRKPSPGSEASGGRGNVSRRLFDDLAEHDDLGVSLAEGSWTHDSVARLLREEAEDIRLASRLARSTAAGGLDAQPGPGPAAPRFPLTEPVRHAQKDMRAMPVGDNVLYHGEGEEPGSLTPAEVAAMMHRLEHGVSMAAPPEQLFKFLFPNASKSKMAKKSSKEDGAVDAETPKAANDYTLHQDDSCPIVCFGSAYPDDLFKARTMVQLRGDAPPPWFPGYFMALPQTGGALQVMPSPSEVLQAAYQAARPANIPPESRIVY